MVIPMYWDEAVTFWSPGEKQGLGSSDHILEVSWHFEIISIHLWVPRLSHYIVYLTSNDGINGSIYFSSNRSCWSFLACFWCSFGAVLLQLDPDIGTVTGRSAGWNANDRLLCGQRLGSIHWGDFATANHQHFWVRWFVMFDCWFDMVWLMTINDDQCI